MLERSRGSTGAFCFSTPASPFLVSLGAVCFGLHPWIYGLSLNFAPDTYFDLVQWNLFSGGPQCILCRLHQPEATGNFHEGQGDALDGIRSEDFRQFVPVVFNVVQFGAADDHRFPPEKILVQGRVGERNAIGHDKEIRILEIGGVDRDECELDRPMGER